MRPRLVAFKTYKMKDGTLVGLFQGNRGMRPDIDFVIKILIPGIDKKLRPPTHTFWVVDLLLKIPQYRNEVREIVQYYIDYYARTLPFSSVQETPIISRLLKKSQLVTLISNNPILFH